MQPDPLHALGDVLRILHAAHIEYFLGDSFASGARGEFSATNDLDLVIRIDSSNVDVLLSHLLKHRFGIVLGRSCCDLHLNWRSARGGLSSLARHAQSAFDLCARFGVLLS